LATGQAPDEFNIDEPPRGAWFKETDRGWLVGASIRSAVAFFVVPFMCVWSGISLGGIYGTQIVKGELNLGMSLFGIPFIYGTLLWGSIAAMTVCGKVIVTTEDDDGRVFVGVGPIGWTGRFSRSSIVSVEKDGYRHSGDTTTVISLVGNTRL